ncbi:LysM peptidoglycan-binding domain-containing protein [Acidisoma cladoniae]|uniref:LysM peptidoglycan-binding domain-containing protein n=1 Tax=Acidisoma cladoniae TaxID=3040935 RepID=UPI00254CF761|nr:LysM peptidoglycan-binding domain-containing protein [Acidisoma sp. PAMC 29798]
MTEATHNRTAPAGRPARSAVPAILILLCLLGAGGVYLYDKNRTAAPSHVAAVVAPQPQPIASSPAAPKPAPQQAMTQPASTQHATTPQAAPAVTAAPAPTVDVVRVDKNGALVMAGQAPAGETVTVRNGETVLGQATADPNGQWVFLPDAPLPAGVHQLSLSSQGVTAVQNPAARTTVLLNVPTVGGPAATATVSGTTTPATALNAGPLVVVSQGTAAPRLLLAPPGSHPGVVGLDVVQYDDKGRIRFTGHAHAGRTVRLYVDNQAVGDAVADPSGQWSLSPTNDLAPGLHKLRTDELAPTGKVAARSEVPFARADVTKGLNAGQAIVQPGDCLWTIARQSYGHGVQYTAIFQANLDQIRDPALIYPGQAFRMPTADEAAHAPPPLPRHEGGKTSKG